MTLRLGVARLAERSTKCASVPKRGEHSTLCDGAPKECGQYSCPPKPYILNLQLFELDALRVLKILRAFKVLKVLRAKERSFSPPTSYLQARTV